MKRLLPSAAIGIACALALVLSHQTAAAGDQNGAWGAIKGQIILDPNEQIPQPKKINVGDNQNPKECLAKGPLFSQEWVVNKNDRGVRWVFVWLQPAPGGQPLAIHPNLAKIKNKEVVIDQPCCQFEPHAIAIREGQSIIAKNSATIAHNVHWTGFAKNPGNNIIVPAKQSITISDLKADKYPVKFTCDIHGWMGAWVRIFDNPYFAVTDEDGKFEIKDAPAGTFQMVIWHESGYGPGQRKGIPVTIAAGKTTDVGEIKLTVPQQ
jgi:plastocyanin